jgi:CelD/BcsL family acetyltransferase involved in cellulose biosynthesis
VRGRAGFRNRHNGLLREFGHDRREASHIDGPIVGQANSILHARAPLPVEAWVTRSANAAQRGSIALTLHNDLAAAERDWRDLERNGDCTPFQSFDWLAAWQRHVGALTGAMPAIIVCRRGAEILFLLPLAVERGTWARRLTFLGQDLCDYNAPLLARDFSRVLTGDQFSALWRESLCVIQSRAALRHDMVVLEKMPKTVGRQQNPMLALDVQLNPSGAYETALGADWEAFYTEKRSSATRRRDRTKLKKLGELGDVRFAEPSGDEIATTLDLLIAQKSKSFARMGVPNMFARPGYPEFFRDLALSSRSLVHLSRLDVGETFAAVNLGLTFGDCYYHILASYDDGEVSRFGPGAAHLRELLQHAIRRGCKRFDFTIGDEPYKRDWCETEQQLFDHSAAVTLRGFPAAAAALAWGRAKRAIKHSAPLWNLALRVRATMAALRQRP